MSTKTNYNTLAQKLKAYTYWLGKDEPCSRDIHPPICDDAAAAIQSLLGELEQFREFTKLVPSDRLKELAEADARGMVLISKIPIGTKVYRLHQGSKEEVRVIDGEEYTRKVPNWYITHHEYSWVDAIVDADHPERSDNPCYQYYFTLEDARAERDRINAGGDLCQG